ncbi:MAG TPA: hypothetical protein ENK18_26665 [Deltaproteobacteria bacterium]|nr:hypothetical protein [Deltaproteobacteria bacterium]
MFLISRWLSTASAGTLWLHPPSSEDAARVALLTSGAEPITRLELRASAARITEADLQALRNLDGALQEARPYETELDGERVILELLEPAIRSVGVLRDDTDRSALFGTLAYQGFALSRFFGADLATDPAAEPWRTEILGVAVETPWLDAIALDPRRRITSYEIAEAPQRRAFTERRAQLVNTLPGLLLPPKVDDTLVVDGRPTTPGPSGTVAVLPGRHLIHLERRGLVIDRWDVRVASGERVVLQQPVPDPVLETFLGDLVDGAPIPPELEILLEAHGEPLWIAEPTDEGPKLFKIEGDTLVAVPIPRTPDPVPIVFSLGILGGWLASDDFYLQDPTASEATYATVNAGLVGGYASAGLDLAPLRITLGLDLLVPTGETHIALTGSGSMRARPIPHLAAGLPWIQATAGLLFPYHPAVGGQLALPGPGPLKGRLSGWYAPGPERLRSDGSTWFGNPIASVSLGLGIELGGR